MVIAENTIAKNISASGYFLNDNKVISTSGNDVIINAIMIECKKMCDLNGEL